MTSNRLCLKDTMTGRKEIFKPITTNRAKIFTCGPSIYSRPHIGNYRTYIFEDILQRYLEYLGYRVDRLINFTDVEDKALREAKLQGRDIYEITRFEADRFIHECKQLRIKLPQTIPRSSTCVDQAVKLIKQLIETGHAYRHGKNIYFDPLKFKGFGKLYGLDMSRWPRKRRRFHKDTYPGQRWNLGDFILWMGRKEGDDSALFWETKIGDGRPSWNIQDPAMIIKHLGCRIDISCGGVDNLFRHHDYNIAVIEAVSGKKFAEYWLHGEHVLANGVKMSKSRGNITYLNDLLDLGYDPHHVRFYLGCTHYRKKLNMDNRNLQTARGKIDTFREMVRRITDDSEGGQSDDDGVRSLIDSLKSDFEKQMNDDLNVHGAFGKVYDTLSRLVILKSKGRISYHDSKRVKHQIDRMDTVLKFLN